MTDGPLERSGKHDASEASTANVIYILYLVGIVLWLIIFIGAVMAYLNQGKGEKWVQSHYRFQIRTFWIAVLIAVVGGLTMPIGIGFLILPAGAVWLIVRCAKGMTYIGNGQAHPDPESWMFG